MFFLTFNFYSMRASRLLFQGTFLDSDVINESLILVIWRHHRQGGAVPAAVAGPGNSVLCPQRLDVRVRNMTRRYASISLNKRVVRPYNRKGKTA